MRRFGLIVMCLAMTACTEEPGEAPPNVPAVLQSEPVELSEALPDMLLGRDRQLLDVSRDAALDAEVVRATARYSEITVALADFGSSEMTTMMGYGRLAASETQTMGFPSVRETVTDSAVVRLLISDRVLVEVTAGSDAVADSALAALDVSALRP